MLKTFLFNTSACAALALSIFSSSAYAAEAAEAESDAAADIARTDDIVVTGSNRAQRRFDVSYAINTISSEDVEKIAPVNFADLIGQLPGFQTEITGGEVQNIYRIRGLPTDGSFVTFQQDGLPLFHENDGVFFRGDAIIKQDLMTDRAEVVRGGPAPIYASYSGAIINSITVTGNDTSRGKAQVTVGDTGLYRLDAYQAGPISDNLHYAVGGFIRQHDGYRDNGFPNDKGGQIRANIKHLTDNGFVKVSLNYVNDHNAFYLPIPISDPRDPSVSLDKYIDYFTGTMNSPAFRNVAMKYRNGAGQIVTRNGDLSDGRHMRMLNFGAQYEGDFDGWLISAKAGYTQGKLRFSAFYSTTNPEDGDAYRNNALTRAIAGFGNDVSSVDYVFAGTNTAYDPNSASGLVMQAQYRDVASNFYSAQGDLSVGKKFATGFGTHDMKLGLYASAYGEDRFQLYQNYLIEVMGQPRTLDMVAYDSNGEEIGRLTDNGALNFAATLNRGDSDATMFAIYANNNWEISPNFRIDAGIRHERYDYKGWYEATENGVDLGDAGTLADNATIGFTGQTVNQKLKTNVTNWTVGANYDFSRNVGVYVRASHTEVPTNVQYVMNVNPNNIDTIADQYEAGLKLAYGRSHLYVTGFYTNFDPLNASFLAFDPVTGQNDQTRLFVGKARVTGVEFDGSLALNSWFKLNGALTVSNPQYRKFRNAEGADPRLVEGNQITRQPKVYGNIRPSFDFSAGETDISVYGRYTYMGKRYVDLYNNTALPAYGTIGAGVTLRKGSWQAQVVGDNLFNTKGLTEGNTRTDALTGQGASEAIYGRPIFGRNVRFVVSKSW